MHGRTCPRLTKTRVILTRKASGPTRVAIRAGTQRCFTILRGPQVVARGPPVGIPPELKRTMPLPTGQGYSGFQSLSALHNDKLLAVTCTELVTMTTQGEILQVRSLGSQPRLHVRPTHP